MNELEERVVDLIVKHAGILRRRVQLSSRLAQDIGMDGDDAVEFFERSGKEFSVDLRALYDHWHRHFLPEGWGSPPLGYTNTPVIVQDLLDAAIARKWVRSYDEATSAPSFWTLT